MDTKCLDELIKEATATALPLAVVLNGLDRIACTQEMEVETKREILESRDRFNRRFDLLNVLKNSLSEARDRILDLLADGHPAPILNDVSQNVKDEVSEYLKSIQAANEQFKEPLGATAIDANVIGPRVNQ